MKRERADIDDEMGDGASEKSHENHSCTSLMSPPRTPKNIKTPVVAIRRKEPMVSGVAQARIGMLFGSFLRCGRRVRWMA